ncbi:hypothetical protein M0D69_26080 [Caballeronia sp. SEWSISQ10-4 2]|uniref:hypothetical protein n=1 Tax=Caballeronia sp. SEWSISQ10-4 2 TaxID=2937438 RepID=UPI002655A3A4|nr:hypothetical protein [Caballeronia sp. SEWSISQ10-4 2]MDN7181406.1 hypothetical protein [Caballeronia sp. SEWSISQ10-4 2]
MSYKTCQNWLASVWVAFFILQVGLLVLRSVVGAADSDESRKLTSEMWSWYIPMVMPTLSIIVAALYAAAPAARQEMPTPVIRLVILIVLSLAYLLSLSTLIVLPPSLGTSPKEHLDLLHSSNYWLGAFQLCIGASLGNFFPKKSGD